MTPQKGLLVAGYCRVSTFEQARHGTSLEEQKKEIQTYASAHGWQVQFYEDAGISGAKKDRPALTKMLGDAAAGKFSKVIFLKIDRFGRNIRAILDNYDTLEKLKIGLISIRENIDTSTAMGRMVRNILATLAEFEREMIIERTVEPRAAKIKQGKILAFKRPYGYAWNKEKKQFEIVEEEKAIVQKIFQYYALADMTIEKLWNRLKVEGIRNRDGRTFHPTTLNDILRRECYGTGKFYSYRTMISNGKRVERPKIEWVEYPAPIIIDKGLLEKVQKRLNQGKGRPKNFKKDDPYILRGLLKCAECDSPITTQNAGGSKHLRRYYICHHRNLHESEQSSYPEKRKGKCGLPMIPAEKIENQVMNSVLNDLANPFKSLTAFRQELNRDMPDYKGMEKSLQGVNIRIGQSEEKVSHWLDLYAEGKMDKALLQKKHDETLALIENLRKEKEGLENQLKEYEKRKQYLAEAQKVIPSFRELSGKIIQAIRKMTAEEKKSFLAFIFELRGIKVSRVKKKDLAEEFREYDKWTPAELEEPLGKKPYKLYGEGSFDFTKAAEFLKEKIGDYSLLKKVRSRTSFHSTGSFRRCS